MRIYQLYDQITNFSFSLRYYGYEYLALDENDFLEELKFNDFERDNRCYSKGFLDEKLLELKEILLYFQKLLSEGLKRYETHYDHFDLFVGLHKEFIKKGVSYSVEDFNRNTRILHHLTQDIADELRNRLEIISALSDSRDYVFQDSFPVTYVVNGKLLSKESENRGDINYVEWFKIKSLKYTELATARDYKEFFNQNSLKKFESFKHEINTSWTKPKIVMLVRLLNDDGYFKKFLSKEEMVRFTHLFDPSKKYILRNFQEEKPSKEKWKNDYGGFEF